MASAVIEQKCKTSLNVRLLNMCRKKQFKKWHVSGVLCVKHAFRHALCLPRARRRHAAELLVSGSCWASSLFARRLTSQLCGMLCWSTLRTLNTPRYLPSWKRSRFGAATVRRLYGDFVSKPELKPWREASLNLSFKLVDVQSYVAEKSSSDIGMILEAMDLLDTNKEIDGFLLPCQLRLRFHWARPAAPIIGQAPSGLRVKWIRHHHSRKHAIGLSTWTISIFHASSLVRQKTSSPKLKLPPETVLALLQDAVESTAENDGWGLGLPWNDRGMAE